MMKQNSKISKIGIGALWALMLSMIGVYVFYILYHAEWLIGDDAAMLRHTAFGIPFHIYESILPEVGFFRPFDYLHENIVLLFHSGMHNAFEHYIINAVSFVLCMGSLIGILWKTVKPQDAIGHAILISGVIVIASRLIGVYINIFGPVFGVYTYHMLAIFFLCLFLENDKKWAMALSLFCWAYSMLIYENVCLVLGCMGLFSMLFTFRQLNKKQRIYCYTLIGMAVAFILAYLFVIYLPTRGQTHYDPAHDSGVSMIANAKNILMGQKFIWVAALVWLWRQVQLIRKQTTYHVLYDTLLWAAGGMVVGAVLLRLNWTMYYYDAIILSLPAIVYFLMNSHKEYGKYIALSVMALFAAWHSYKVPNTIKSNQKDRTEIAMHMQFIADWKTAGGSVIWYDGEMQGDVAEGMKFFRKEATKSYMRYLLKDLTWNFDSDSSEKTIVFSPEENVKNEIIPELCRGVECTYIGVTSGVYYYVIQ